MDSTGALTPFADLPLKPAKVIDSSVEDMVENIHAIINKSIDNRVDFDAKLGGLLSGGMDSSVICYLCSKKYKEKFGDSAKLFQKQRLRNP